MLLSLLLLSGCGTDLSGFLPQVRFDRFEVKSIDFERIDTDFVFEIDNPNPIGAPVDRFQYQLQLGGVEILSGDDPDGLEIVAGGSSEFALPVGLDFQGIYEAVQATRGLDYVPFGLAGGFGFDTDLGPVDISFDEDGSYPALRIPRFNPGKLRLENIGASEVDFSLDVDVDNDHGSSLFFQNLDFELDFAGVKVGGGVVDDAGEVAGATTRTVNLPFSVDYVKAIEAISAAMSGDKLRVGLDANMDVDTPFGVLPLHVDETGDVEVVQ